MILRVLRQSRAACVPECQVVRTSVDLRVRASRRGESRFVLLRFDVLATGLGYGGGTWVPCRSRRVRGPHNAVRRPAPLLKANSSTPSTRGARSGTGGAVSS